MSLADLLNLSFSKIKQFTHGLFFDDENSRERSALLHARELRAGHAEEQPAEFFSLISPDFSRVWGVDISHWDGNVTLSVTASVGASFVFIKGLDGTLQTKYYVDNRQRAIAAGLKHAPYQWLYRNANVSCTAQAQAMKNLLDKYPTVLPPVIDFEWTYWGGAQSNPSWADLDIYVTELLRLNVRKPLLYTAAGYANMFGQIPAALKDKFAGLWIANYGVSSPALPYGFVGWDFWQFSSSGDALVYAPNDVGKKEVDLNYAVSRQRLDELAGIPPQGGLMYGKVNTAALNIRSGPGASYEDIGDLVSGDIVTASEIIGGWWHLVEINGVPVTRESWASGTYIVESQPPAPERVPFTLTVAGFKPFEGELEIDHNV